MVPARSGLDAPAESRPLKAVGLALALVAMGLFAWLTEEGRAAVPLTISRFGLLAAATLVDVNVLAAAALFVTVGCGAGRRLRDPRRRRAIALQIVVANALAPALLFGLLEDGPAVGPGFDASDLSVAVSLAGIVLVVVAWRLWRRSRQHEALDADEAMSLDPRPPVLYLRSFVDDGQAMLDGDLSLPQRLMGRLLPMSPEQELAAILGRVGPLVAIGKPGEPLPELGAARLYVAHDRWQAKVIELMRRARLVVVRVGSSPGVLWEIERALDSLPRQRLVLAVLGGASVASELVARLAPVLGPSFEAALPEPRRGLWNSMLFGQPRRRMGGLVCFAEDGRSRPVAVRNWPVPLRDLVFAGFGRPSAPALRCAWRQVFAHLGLPWRDVARPRSRAVAVLLALSFGWLGAQWFYLGKRRRGWIYVATIPLLLAPAFASYIDAVRFIWVDRADFDARFAAVPDAAPRSA